MMEFIESEQHVVTSSRPGSTPGHAQFESNMGVSRMLEGWDVALKSTLVPATQFGTLAPATLSRAPDVMPTEIYASREECPSVLDMGDDDSVTVYSNKVVVNSSGESGEHARRTGEKLEYPGSTRALPTSLGQPGNPGEAQWKAVNEIRE